MGAPAGRDAGAAGGGLLRCASAHIKTEVLPPPLPLWHLCLPTSRSGSELSGSLEGSDDDEGGIHYAETDEDDLEEEGE